MRQLIKKIIILSVLVPQLGWAVTDTMTLNAVAEAKELMSQTKDIRTRMVILNRLQQFVQKQSTTDDILNILKLPDNHPTVVRLRTLNEFAGFLSEIESHPPKALGDCGDLDARIRASETGPGKGLADKSLPINIALNLQKALCSE